MTNTVNKEAVRLWVDALRDPQLIQGYGKLATTHEGSSAWAQCCLDVACRVAIANGIELQEDVRYDGKPEDGKMKRGYKDDESESERFLNFTTLPHQAMVWFGFNSIEVQLGKTTAMALNDGRKLTFPEIADVIEATYLHPQEVIDGE